MFNKTYKYMSFNSFVDKYRRSIEQEAVGFTNYLRESFNELPLRNKYTGQKDFVPCVFSSDNDRLIGLAPLINDQDLGLYVYMNVYMRGDKPYQTYTLMKLDNKGNFNFKYSDKIYE